MHLLWTGGLSMHGLFGRTLTFERTMADELRENPPPPDPEPHTHFHEHDGLPRHAHEHTHLTGDTHPHSALLRSETER